jgi:hypothetical protein
MPEAPVGVSLPCHGPVRTPVFGASRIGPLGCSPNEGAVRAKTRDMKGTFTRTYGVKVPFMLVGSEAEIACNQNALHL